jgi:FkbM family methyltransferase
VARFVSTVLVVALLAGTAAAFALTEGLKLQPTPILGTDVDKVLSPVCGCDSSSATISFRLRESDVLDVTAVDENDDVVATIVRGERFPAGLVELEFSGRDDDDLVLPEGEYRPRVHLREEKVTTVLPNLMEIDVTPPVVEEWEARPRVLSPDGDRRRDVLTVRYRLSEPAKGLLFVGGQQRVEKRFARTDDVLTWSGRVDGRGFRAGTYELALGAEDPAGNLARRTEPVPLRVRYVSLGRSRVLVTGGRRFAIRVSSDARRVRWQLGARSGSARLLVVGEASWSHLASTGRHADVREEIDVAVVSIDELVAAGTIPPPDVLKIDIEGAELQAIAGMRMTLERHRPAIVCELHDTNARFCALMDELGYVTTNLDGPQPVAAAGPVHALAQPR